MIRTIEFIENLLQNRILILDGAMGTMLQAQGLSASDFNAGKFADHSKPLVGNNDVLNITKPEAVKNVHRQYLRAGADIIESNTFNSNAVSQSEYGLEAFVYELAFAGAKIAREAADEFSTDAKPRLVAGSVGPTGRTASMSPSVDDPAARNVTFDELASTYRDQIRGLADGGADMILVETIFDTLNCKAALFAAEQVMDELGRVIPVMVSATLSDASGRMLAGQTAEAFVQSVSHAKGLLSIGFNCALGPEEMRPHIEAVSNVCTCFVSAHPNAGLPDAFGAYTQTPEHMGLVMRSFAEEGIINIAGGCCGTTPAHIEAIARNLNGMKPRPRHELPHVLRLSGLEPFIADSSRNFINIGERTNVAGSKKFLRIVKAGDYKEAAGIALHQIENGASVIDVNMDDAMLDKVEAMRHFLLYIASEPEIARMPVMIDSSDWNVVLAGLKCVQGKSIVNSISLKEGEDAFLKKARDLRSLGAAVLVMAFDEKGQADTVDRRVSICRRSFRLLTEQAGIPAEDIIFDPNVFAVATGMPEHDNYAKDFIEAVKQIHREMPLCGISGGISNVSFSFRGNDTVRGALHTVFLKHAIENGLTMGIVNAAQLGIYEELDPELRNAAEDVILNRRPDAAERLLSIAAGLKMESVETGAEPEWRKLPLAERIVKSLVKGDDSYAESDMAEALKSYPSPMSIVEGPLMDGMKVVGGLFSSGRMFLPQVVKTARVMKRSVSVLMPEIQKSNAGGAGGPVVVLATVKGDVHDIGKNIVSVVLQCNNCRVIDLGVMVPAETIVDAAVKNHADVIGLSGLITPSLEEMIHVAAELERRGLKIPVILGGAATSKLHTAMKIQPVYSGAVVHTLDASSTVPVVAALTNPKTRENYIRSMKAEYAELLSKIDETGKKTSLIPFAEAVRKAEKRSSGNPAPKRSGVFCTEFSLEDLLKTFDWDSFSADWDTPENSRTSAELAEDAKKLLAHSGMSAKCVYGIFPVKSSSDSVAVEGFTIPFLRSQTGACRSLADFLATDDWMGMFAVTVSGADAEAEKWEQSGDSYSSLLTRTLATRLAECAAELADRKILAEFHQSGIRPAPGYPSLPDHTVKKEIFKILDVEKNIGVRLTENFMMTPLASVCALCMVNPEAEYIPVKYAEDQLRIYAEQRGMSPEKLKKLLA